MSVPEFVDTNVLVYAYDVSDPAKQTIAQGLVKRAVAGRSWHRAKYLPSLPRRWCISFLRSRGLKM